eukprot:jgi/Galph1/2603/GphlegSOOS_G1270.1
MGCCSVPLLDMRRLLDNQEETSSQGTIRQQSSTRTRNDKFYLLYNALQLEYDTRLYQSGYSEPKDIPTTLSSAVHSNFATAPIITRSFPEDKSVSSPNWESEDMSLGSPMIKKRRKTKAEREARRLNPAVYVPSPRPRFVTCKGCKEELWPPNCRYHGRHCSFAADHERGDSLTSEEEDKVSIKKLINE